mgnify:CR=1 FL=1
MAKLVSKTYGDALFETAVESNRLDDFSEEAKGILAVLRENQELSRLMNHPQIVKEEKIHLIENIFKGKVADEMVGLMIIIVEKDHFAQTESVLEYFIDRVKEHKSIGTAYVTSAMELSEQQKQSVEQRLLETTKYVSFEMHYDVDAALIGGMVIRIGDRVVDSSIRTKLYGLSREHYNIPLGIAE